MPITLPHTIIGHTQQREGLKRLVQNKRLPSTLMFAGNAGIGKKLVALELCRTLLCEKNVYGGCGECKGCHIFDSGNTPDFHFVQCLEKDQVSIESLRDLLYDLGLSAFAGKARLVVFDNAEYLSVQAANLLLKTLEEPRANIHFMLITASPSKLPSTLLSRCQIWYFDSLKPGEVKGIIEGRIRRETESVLGKIPVTELAELSAGSLDGLESVAEHYETWQELRRRLPVIAGGDAAAAMTLAHDLAKDKENLRIALQLMRLIARTEMYLERDKEKQARWALCLHNLVSAERYIFERNLAGFHVLSFCFLQLLGRPDLGAFTTLTNSAKLIERTAV